MLNLGERIRQARLDMGLTQSQLCRDLVSRNMLSLIESGTANPSLSTLEELAKRLKKPVGYFFGENSLALQERSRAEEAWEACRAGKYREAARLLNSQKNWAAFSDVRFLKGLILLRLAEQALGEKRYPYAEEMLKTAGEELQDFPELRRSVLLIQGRLQDQAAEPVCRELPSLDGELLLRARAALEKKNPDRAAQLLEAAENVKTPEWTMLRGRTYMLQSHYRSAARCFHQAEKEFPRETALYLEQCYRELEDFKQAYFYACRQK